MIDSFNVPTIRGLALETGLSVDLYRRKRRYPWSEISLVASWMPGQYTHTIVMFWEDGLGRDLGRVSYRFPVLNFYLRWEFYLWNHTLPKRVRYHRSGQCP